MLKLSWRVGGGGEAMIVTNQDVARLLKACGDHRELVFRALLQMPSLAEVGFIHKHLVERSFDSTHHWLRPLQRTLQGRYADCRCSVLGHLMMASAVLLGGMTDRLQPSNYGPTSEVELMIELGPVQWGEPIRAERQPRTEETKLETTAAGPAAASTADPGPPRLVVAETDNPGYVLVLQERGDDCPHAERRPLKAEAVRRFMRDYRITTGGHTTQTSTPAPAYSHPRDAIPCLHVPIWWFSDEFFTRQRRNNWPPEAVRDNIRQFGLHLVPVGAPGSNTEGIEWSLSFARAELVISYQLTDTQRSTVIAFKICLAATGEGDKVIKPSFVKTALLWLCEQTLPEEWTSVTQGVLKLLDFLDEAVSTGNLPCYFYSRINLLQFTSRADQDAMKRALGTIRLHIRMLLTKGVCAREPELRRMLTHEMSRLSERCLRVCLARLLIRRGVVQGVTYRVMMSTTDDLYKALPVLLRSYTPSEVASLVRGWSRLHDMQNLLFRALTVAPEDVASRVRFSASGDGFIFDAAPLLELLTEDDLGRLLVEPNVVRAWLRRQHQLPETQRPAGLPADLKSPRDLCDLLLNIPLLISALQNCAPTAWAAFKRNVVTQLPPMPALPPVEQMRQNARRMSLDWKKTALQLQTSLGMDPQMALWMACRVAVELGQFWDDPETSAEQRRIQHSLRDPWQLRQSMLRVSD